MESLAKKIISLLSLSLFFAFLLSVPSSRALENGLALTPPMGWNSWNRFACHVTEDLVKSAASFATKVPSHGAAMLRIIP
jgi:alpha-galactosidase